MIIAPMRAAPRRRPANLSASLVAALARHLSRSALVLALAAIAVGTVAPPDSADAKGRTKHATHKHAPNPKAKGKSANHHQPRKLHVAAKSPSASANSTPETPVTNTAAPSKPLQILTRAEILETNADRLERAGRHLLIGFHSWADVKALVEKRAIAGIFITDHNVRNRTAAAIKADIDALQATRVAQGMPPLIIAADQEGGAVSRLSPPLKRQMSLGRLLKDMKHDDERRKAVDEYADAQAAELKRIGVTLNFAPVVDLKLNPSYRDDGETRLRLRAISADPYLVAKVAGWYCDKVAESGIMCTLKHFPGLGRVARDTHVATGEIAASEGQLELNDWVPFRRVMVKPNAATMLGHVRVSVIDKDTPASYSKALIGGVIRKQWAYDGLLITDDFSMGAIAHSKGGVGAAAVKSLDAGADIVLVSFVEHHFDIIMSALLAADADNAVDRVQAAASRDRIARIVKSTAQTATTNAAN